MSIHYSTLCAKYSRALCAFLSRPLQRPCDGTHHYVHFAEEHTERSMGVFKFTQLTQRFNPGPLTPKAYISACDTTLPLLVACGHQHYEQPGHAVRGAEHN